VWPSPYTVGRAGFSGPRIPDGPRRTRWRGRGSFGRPLPRPVLRSRPTSAVSSPRRVRRWVAGLALRSGIALLVPLGAAAQPNASAPSPSELAAPSPLEFGSADDLFERGSGRAEREATAVGLFGGAAYLPDTWRGALRAEAEGSRGPVSAAVSATLHPAAGGLYGPEADELYDVLRAVDYVRLDPSAGRPVYVRLGPSQHVTLGVGALARQYRTTTAWDERALGVEAAVRAGRFAVAAFADDVRLGGVVGGEVEVRTTLAAGPLGGLRVTVGAVHDLGLPAAGDSALTGIEATVRGDFAGGRFAADAPFGVSPFVTAARYLGAGSTLGAGADVDVFRFSDALRARLRAAVFVSSARFVPGHVGPFYAVSNADERIVSGLGTDGGLVGTPLDSLRAGVDVVVDVRFLAFGRFEVSQHVRRHVGADRASAYSLRLAARLPRRARAELAVERQGFRGLWSFLGGLGAENALVLDVAAPVGRVAQAFVRSRYGYRRLDDAVAGPGRFLTERRFEPLVGVRVGLR
jgi:hypothetical protein